MKTIEFQGAEFEVPDWARWIAQDNDFSTYAYERKPTECDGFYASTGGKVELVFTTDAPCVLKEIK